MKEIFENLFIGNQKNYEQDVLMKKGWSIVMRAKNLTIGML